MKSKFRSLKKILCQCKGYLILKCTYLYKNVDHNSLDCHAGHPEGSRCHTRGEFEESIICRQRGVQARDHLRFGTQDRLHPVQSSGYYKLSRNSLDQSYAQTVKYPFIKTTILPGEIKVICYVPRLMSSKNSKRKKIAMYPRGKLPVVLLTCKS